MTENISTLKKSNHPKITYVYLAWVIILFASMYNSIFLLQHSAQKIFADNLSTKEMSSPDDLALRVQANNAMAIYKEDFNPVLARTIVEGLGIVIASVLILLKKRDGIWLGLFSVIAGLVFDIVNPTGNIGTINIIGLILLIVLLNKTKVWIKKVEE
jgi:hypothetical protein